MDVEIVRGTTCPFLVTIDHTDGTPYSPRPGDEVVFALRRKTTDGLLVIKTAAVEPDATARFKLDPEDTENLCCDNYLYDVGLRTEGEFFMIIPARDCRLKKNTANRRCGK